MSKVIQNELSQKYRTIYGRVSKAIQTGKFGTYSAARRQALCQRLYRYEARLKHYGIAVASAAALFFAPHPAVAQIPAGTEFRVNTYTTSAQGIPIAAMDSAGDFVIAWHSSGQDGNLHGVYAQRYNSSGTAQGTEFLVNTYTTSFQRFPSVAIDSDGDFVIAWQSSGQDGSYYGIYAQRYNSSGMPQGTEFRVNTHTTNDQRVPSVAMDSDGNFVIAWNSELQDGSGYGIYAQRYNSSGTPQGSEFLVNTYTNSEQRFSSVAMDSDGDFVVVWQSSGQDGSNYGIYAQRYNSSGTPQGSEFLVNTYTTNQQRLPSVAMDSAGDFVVAWQSSVQDGTGYGIYAQRYNSSGTPQGSEFLVNSYTTFSQSLPSVAMDSDGDFVITWQSYEQDLSYEGVYAQQYNSSGTAQGSEFRVNTNMIADQNFPSVAIDSDGDFVITWQSDLQDGSYNGIYAQRYASAFLPVELLYFAGEATDKGNLLTWATASEENNEGFEIQKSTDGRTFEKVGFVAGNGTSFDQQTYVFLDGYIGDAIAYYRLKQMDFDGDFEYSELIVLHNNGTTTAEVLLYPSPVLDVLTIENAEGFCTVYNTLGQHLRQFEITSTLYFLNTDDLPIGTYTLQIRRADGTAVVKSFLK
jgi:phosphoheptose isomerase